MKIKNHIWGWNHWMGSASLGLLIVSIALVIGLPRLGQTSPIPGLSAALTSSNTLLLTVTNGVSTEYYTVYSKAALQTNFSWSGSITGALGQTNFTVPLGPGLSGFFKAESGTDRDGDGIPNWEDANPNDPNVGILTITIVSPTNGSTLY